VGWRGCLNCGYVKAKDRKEPKFLDKGLNIFLER